MHWYVPSFLFPGFASSSFLLSDRAAALVWRPPLKDPSVAFPLFRLPLPLVVGRPSKPYRDREKS